MSEVEERINNIIASNLVRLLKVRNRTQLELAEYLGVTQATISNWCNGIKMPRMDKIDLICKFFDIRRSQLMDEPSSSSEADQADRLFIEKYSRDVYDAAMKYSKLDSTDRARATERIDTLLEGDKYKKSQNRSSDRQSHILGV